MPIKEQPRKLFMTAGLRYYGGEVCVSDYDLEHGASEIGKYVGEEISLTTSPPMFVIREAPNDLRLWVEAEYGERIKTHNGYKEKVEAGWTYHFDPIEGGVVESPVFVEVAYAAGLREIGRIKPASLSTMSLVTGNLNNGEGHA